MYEQCVYSGKQLIEMKGLLLHKLPLFCQLLIDLLAGGEHNDRERGIETRCPVCPQQAQKMHSVPLPGKAQIQQQQGNLLDRELLMLIPELDDLIGGACNSVVARQFECPAEH